MPSPEAGLLLLTVREQPHAQSWRSTDQLSWTTLRLWRPVRRVDHVNVCRLLRVAVSGCLTASVWCPVADGRAV